MNIINDRIYLDGSKGVVKFFGDVPETSGQWVGVDWDDLKRGKHNGILNGVKYFTTR